MRLLRLLPLFSVLLLSKLLDVVIGVGVVVVGVDGVLLLLVEVLLLALGVAECVWC